MQQLIGYLWAFLAVFFWGIMFPVGRFLMGRGVMEPSVVAMSRFLGAFPLLLAIGWIIYRKKMFPKAGRDWLWMILLGLVGAAMMSELLYVAQRTIPTLNASLLEAYVPVQVMILSFLGGTKPTKNQLVSILVGFLGTMLVLRVVDGSGLRLTSLTLGDLLIFLSGLCWAIYTACGRPVANRLGGYVFATWTILFGGLWLLAYNLVTGVSMRMPTWRVDWYCVAFLALGPTALSFLGWNQAQKKISLSQLSFMDYFPPLIAAIFGLVFLKEDVTLWQWIGIVIVILSARLQ